MIPVEFNVSNKYPLRHVACRIAMCLGISNPLAWEDSDEGHPFWRPEEEKFDVQGNDWWLRKVRDNNDGTYTVSLDYRYSVGHATYRQEAIEGLAKWLAADINLGPH